MIFLSSIVLGGSRIDVQFVKLLVYETECESSCYVFNIKLHIQQ